MRIPRILICGWMTLTLTHAIMAENWPQFRGPTGQGLSAEKDLPISWSATSGILWKVAIPGEGWSSPIVWADRVFITTATDRGTSCRMLALDCGTGKVLWDREVFKQTLQRKEARNSFATPTPATDGRRVYAVFHDGGIAALEIDGATVWSNRDFPFYSQHGLATSPILWQNLLISARDGSSQGEDKSLGWQTPWDQSFLLALDKETGQVRWKGLRGRSRIGHVVPCLWTAPDGRVQVISGAGDVVQGFDAKAGQRIWTSFNKGEGVVPSSVVGDGLVFTACGYSGRESIKAFRLGGEGDLKETNLVWEQRQGMPKVPSLLYIKPYLYSITDNGMATCLKGDTGEIVWQERLGGAFSASPVYADGRIYFLSDGGETTVVAAGPQCKSVAKNPLKEKCQASMAVSRGRLFIRTEKNLFCIGEP
jgi:outer membrane protein assembly factor BamB